MIPILACQDRVLRVLQVSVHNTDHSYKII